MSVALEHAPRNVPVVDAADVVPATFDPRTPLVVRGAMDRAMRTWTDTWLLERFGDAAHTVTLDARPAIEGFKKRVSLSEFLRHQGRGEQPEYLFQTWLECHFDAAQDLLGDLDVPPVILRLGLAGKWRMFVGPAMSGTLPHHHHAAINALARGRKRWAIFAGRGPGHTRRLLEEGYAAYDRGSLAADWFVRECPRLRARPRVRLWELIQEPGDLVFIPEGHIHAIVNLDPVLGFGAELFPSLQAYRRSPAGPARPPRRRRNVRPGRWMGP
jgi:histone arginine demethylase JMJD6